MDELTPPTELVATPDPETLGLTPVDLNPVMPPPPMPPVPSIVAPPPPITADPKNQYAALAALGLALGAGARGGGGAALHAFGQQQQQQQAQREEQFRYQQQLAQHNDQIAQQQFRLASAQYESDEKRLQGILLSIQKSVAQAKTPEEYDARIKGFGNMLRGLGYSRLTDDWLRSAAKFVPPDEKKTLTDAMQAFLKNPQNADVLKDPDTLNKAAFSYQTATGDRRTIPFREALLQSGTAFITDPQTGQVVQLKKGTPLEQKVGPQGLFDLTIQEADRQGLDTSDPTFRKKAMEDAIKRARELGRAPAAGGMGAQGGLDEGGVDYLATQYRVLGSQGIPTRIGEADRVKVVNLAAKQARMLGQTPAQAIQKQAAFKADASALTKMKTMSAAAESFENKALAQADIVADLSSKVNRTQWPIVNQAIVSGKANVLGDSNAQQLVNAITTFSTEYAKIMEGSTGSVSASSDAARKAASRLIDARLNKGTLRDTLELMKREMRLTIQGYDATINHITEHMGGAAPTPGPTPPPTGPTEQWERGPNGQLRRKVGL